MNEVAGQKVAEMLPKMLLKMMGALMENGIKSWQIYDNKYSIDLRIRFDHECKAMTGSSTYVYKQGSEADTKLGRSQKHRLGGPEDFGFSFAQICDPPLGISRRILDPPSKTCEEF